MPPLHVMIKPASGLCNMRCRYCFYADEMENRQQRSYGIMAPETLECVVRKALDYAERECTFAFQGGEPTLAGLNFFRDCVRLQKEYAGKNTEVHNAIQTNGYGMTEEWCEFFAENHFLVGLSVDGIKATHDAYRKGPDGEDTYFRILRAAEMLRAAGADFNVLTVVNGRTAPRIRKIYRQYEKLGFRWQQYIACLDPLGESPGGQEYSLTPAVYGQFLIDLFEMWETDLRAGRQPYIRQFENYLAILLGQEPESCEQRGVCGVQHVVEADGSVYPCDFYVLDRYRLGNLREDSFETIQERRRQSGFLEASYEKDPGCGDCPYAFLCRGGCRRHRERADGTMGQNEFCLSYRMFFDACLPGMREIARRLRAEWDFA